MRYVAPAGAPIRLRDLVSWGLTVASRQDAQRDLQDAVARRFGVRHVHATSTGRTGLTVIMRALRRLAPAERVEVIVPSYTCYSVPASIVRAGLTPRLVDVDPATLGLDGDRLARIDMSRVLAIVATNLYGLPNDMPALSAVARQQGVFLVDDAAQAMGARVGGQLSGTHGDVGLFSLDKGKNVSAIDGGLLLTNSDDVSVALDHEARTLQPPSAAGTGRWLVTLAAYVTLLHPRVYWIPNGIPQLGLGATVYTTEFALERLGGLAAALGVTMLGRLDAFTAERRRRAACLMARLDRGAGVVPVQPVATAEPVYLRLPVLAATALARHTLVTALNRAGIGASGSYPESLADVPGLRGILVGASENAAGGRDVARRILTLPTHSWVTRADLARTIEVIDAATRPARRALAYGATAQ